ncbi:MAG: hypothetical protein A4E63_00341 [Syntrophorhabdus sp. PtaU1.Bin050]|nr:MAG: hypothetical protein A4E63_00341 [Syntrophorhabdus sp. PtaU1.Bin050]
MECIIANNKTACTCTYEGCDKKGKCCECVSYHRKRKEIPGCFFSKEGERSYDRSYKRFAAENM